jgi:4-amino-4-deoxy-L-arabinose transferase-like glycosyltransferase
VFLLAFAVRFFAAVMSSTFDINPESDVDAVVFARTADTIAGGLLDGQLLSPDPYQIYNLWGTFLAPYWLLPGPSLFYARVGNALLGAFAIYNVYLIARYYHSHRAGVVATLPMIFYPSFVAVHSTVLREAIILFGITTAVRFLVVPSQKRVRLFTYTIATVLMAVAYLHRPDNAIVYGVGFGTGLLTYAVEAGYLSKRHILAFLSVSPPILLVVFPYIQRGVAYLARVRELRASGRTTYLTDIVPQSVLDFLAFSLVGAVYFLYAPFPWMVETIPDLLVSFEGMISLAFTIAAVWGIRSLIHRNASVTLGLLVSCVVAAVLYGVGTVNYGTGMRHRQMFLWVVFLFGGIGIAEQVRIEWSFNTGEAVPPEATNSSEQTQQVLDD